MMEDPLIMEDPLMMEDPQEMEDHQEDLEDKDHQDLLDQCTLKLQQPQVTFRYYHAGKYSWHSWPVNVAVG